MLATPYCAEAASNSQSLQQVITTRTGTIGRPTGYYYCTTLTGSLAKPLILSVSKVSTHVHDLTAASLVRKLVS